MLVELKDIQSIQHAVYNLPEMGIVQIKGGNSNGKSILYKAINLVVTLGMLDKTKRKALIRKRCDFGEILFKYKDRVLYVYLHKNRDSCRVMYTDDSGTEIIRSFREGGIEALIEKFGFCCFDKNNVCLQMYETFGPMPFVNTSDLVNGEIVNSVTEDAVAKKFIESYKTYTYPKASEQKKLLDKQIDMLYQTKQSIVVYDWKKYQEMKDKMKYYYDILKFAKVVRLDKVNVVPSYTTVDAISLHLEKVNVVPELDIVDVKPIRLCEAKVVYPVLECKLDSVSSLVYQMQQLLNGICPTCGRSLVDV